MSDGSEGEYPRRGAGVGLDAECVHLLREPAAVSDLQEA
jgi:hypothetical protein